MTINEAIAAAAAQHYMYRHGDWFRADGQHRWPVSYWAGRATVRDARIAFVLQHAAGYSPGYAVDVAINCAPINGRWQDVARALAAGRRA
jgi:hypothetical protein